MVDICCTEMRLQEYLDQQRQKLGCKVGSFHQRAETGGVKEKEGKAGRVRDERIFDSR